MQGPSKDQDSSEKFLPAEVLQDQECVLVQAAAGLSFDSTNHGITIPLAHALVLHPALSNIRCFRGVRGSSKEEDSLVSPHSRNSGKK